jgi:hypothetical protein
MDQISMKKVHDWKCIKKQCFIKAVITNFIVDEELFDKFSCMKKYGECKSQYNYMKVQVAIVVTNGVMCSIISRKKA